MLLGLSSEVLAKPYCEPGKVAVSAAMCLLLLDEPGSEASAARAEQAVACARDIEQMLQETAPGRLGLFDTRLHMFLRSPWPSFRLLDLLVRLHPSNDELAEPDMGRCAPHQDWMGDHHEFDWPWFKASLTSALEAATQDPTAFALDPEDGPMSEQYRARWARAYRAPSFREAAAFASSAFYKFRRNQWEAGCHPGIVASYVMQVVTFCVRDTEAWLHRYVGAAWRLMNMLTPLTSLIYTDWPIFLALHLGSLLRRHPSPWAPGKWGQLAAPEVEPHAGAGAAQSLEELVLGSLDPVPEVVYVTAAWGALSQFVGAVLARWAALALPLLLLLALDSEAAESCAAQERPGAIACVRAPPRFGVEPAVAKYLALAAVARVGALVVWLDLDVYLPRDPTAALAGALERAGSPPLAIAGFLTSASLSPSVIAARGEEASGLLLRYASWLFEHPYLLDHQGWDAFLDNREGDFGSGWDYKGRNISSTPDDGLQFSFAPGLCALGAAGRGGGGACRPARYARLGPEFAAGDGWLGRLEGLATFHFSGTTEGQAELFLAFYPYEEPGFSAEARALLAQYRRAPASGDAGSLAARAQPRSHLTAITYAHGCCAKAIERNRRSALDVGVDDARAYGFEDLDPEWAARNAEVLSQRKGGGWWLWKPHLILQTLRDEAVPWHTGVVLWLDAGNFFVGDPQPVVSRALQASDVVAMRLKCCVESDWTSVAALRRLGGSHHTIADRPQLGAYFIVLRKTTTTLAFVEDWLRFSEDPEILLETGGNSNMHDAPGYQRHMADQSIFSVLFKQRGFEALTLEEGHRVVQLDRWRE